MSRACDASHPARRRINHEVLNLFIDYETFGEHQREDSGIFAFFKALVERILGDTEYVFRTPSEIST
ncbi:MAG: hypothetical protein PHG30_09685, partial [Eubacteriales bacterium]|nr:hypothetical protein [Eubacteriales bacterium]